VSPLLLTPALLPRVQTILDASFATTNSATLYAVHPSTSASTIFLSGADLAKFIHSLGKEVTEVDFGPMQTPEGEKKAEKKPEKKVEDKSAG
jgi:prolyl-tRNA synthetase